MNNKFFCTPCTQAFAQRYRGGINKKEAVAEKKY